MPFIHGLLLALAAGGTVAAPSPDASAIDALAEFQSFCAAGKQVWRYSLCGPMVIVDPGNRRAVANVEPADAGFVREGDVWIGTLPEGVGIANTSIDWAGRRWAEVMLPLPQDPVDRRVLLAHEAFHRIQPALGFTAVEGDNAHLDDMQGRTLALLEIAALQAAVGAARDGDDWRAPALDALAYRAARNAAFPNAAQAEGALLANEGLAEYTGIRVAAPDRQPCLVIDRLESVVERASLIRSFGYVVGPAYGFLLDRGGDAWRAEALAGKALPDLLHAQLGAPALPEADLDAYGGTGIAETEQARAEAARQRTEQYTASLVSGPVVTFPFTAMQIEFDPNSLFALGSAGTVYGGATTIRDAWGELKASGEVLIGPDWSYARVPGPAVLDGRTLSGPGWTATLAPGVALVAGERASEQVVRAQP